MTKTSKTITSADALTAIVHAGEALTPSMVSAASQWPGMRWESLDLAVWSILDRAGFDTEACRWLAVQDKVLDSIEVA